jgi:hypothetical protein
VISITLRHMRLRVNPLVTTTEGSSGGAVR